MRIGVIGGGLAGLTSGYLLNRTSNDFRILEKGSECGGLIRSVEREGFTFDCGGSHVIFSKDNETLKFIQGLLGSNRRTILRNTKIMYKNRLIKYPFENGLAGLSNEENFECVYEFVMSALSREENASTSAPENLADWFYHHFGRGIAEKYLLPYNEKIWKFPLDRIGTKWAERIPNPPMADIIKSSIGIETEGYTHQLNFSYPNKGGIQSLARALEEPIVDKIVTNYEVSKIEKEDDIWIVSDGRKQFEFDRIVSTIPLPETTEILDDLPPEIHARIGELRYNSLITVAIGVDKMNENNLSWLYIPDKEILANRVSFPSNYSSCVVPEGKSSLLAEITFTDGDLISRMNDKDIVARTQEDLERLKLLNTDDIIMSIVSRYKYAYVIEDLNWGFNLREILRYFNSLGIDLLGRFGRWDYSNMDDVVRQVKGYVDRRY